MSRNRQALGWQIPLEIDRDAVVLDELIAVGSFGEVWRGKARSHRCFFFQVQRPVQRTIQLSVMGVLPGLISLSLSLSLSRARSLSLPLSLAIVFFLALPHSIAGL